MSEVRKYGLPFIRLGHKRGSLRGDKGSFYCLVISYLIAIELYPFDGIFICILKVLVGAVGSHWTFF